MRRVKYRVALWCEFLLIAGIKQTCSSIIKWLKNPILWIILGISCGFYKEFMPITYFFWDFVPFSFS
jgi:hypothetical protein